MKVFLAYTSVLLFFISLTSCEKASTDISGKWKLTDLDYGYSMNDLTEESRKDHIERKEAILNNDIYMTFHKNGEYTYEFTNTEEDNKSKEVENGKYSVNHDTNKIEVNINESIDIKYIVSLTDKTLKINDGVTGRVFTYTKTQ